MITIALTLLFAAPANAGIANSPHDFSSGSTAASTTGTVAVTGATNGPSTEICVYCHTPHNANTAFKTALWNRATPGGTYTMYTSTTLDMPTTTTPEGVSLACLSCHDGATAATQYAGTDSNGVSGDGSLTVAGANLLGIDLSNDHPISIGYEPTLAGQSTQFKLTSTGNKDVGGLPLYAGSTTSAVQVECATCHNPHGLAGVPKFLRIDNAGSTLCLTCHIK